MSDREEDDWEMLDTPMQILDERDSEEKGQTNTAQVGGPHILNFPRPATNLQLFFFFTETLLPEVLRARQHNKWRID